MSIKHSNSVLFGDNLELLKRFPENIFTAVVTDPPYGLSKQPDMREVLRHWLAGDDYEHRGGGFMGKKWDSFVPGPKVWEEVMRVIKPGAHILSFGGTRTYGLMETAMRIAGAEIRDKIDYFCDVTGYADWVYGSGFPKSHSIGKALDKMAGAEREVIGQSENWRESKRDRERFGSMEVRGENAGLITEAKKWEGQGTALKPAHEPIAIVSKSGEDGNLPEPPQSEDGVPFKYQAKASRSERNKGVELHWLDGKLIGQERYEALEKENEERKDEDGFKRHGISKGNVHPTVKPLELCRYLVRMVKQPEQNLILDPWCGSGSVLVACVLEGCDFIGMDNDEMAVHVSNARIKDAQYD